MNHFYQDKNCTIYNADSRDVLPSLSNINSVVTDPPYAEVNREYGRLTEEEWQSLMRDVVAYCRNALVDNGSAVFILQPNSEKVGRMRPWLWEFMAWTAREWNQVQDAWWWNYTSPPTVHCHRTRGLMRPSVKACVWLGDPDCYRDQSVVLWSESDGNKAKRLSSRNELNTTLSGMTMRNLRCATAALERGGVTPFNLIPISNAYSSESSGAHGHGAGTPLALADWWTRYITPDGGLVVDPFCGAGTTAIVAKQQGLRFIGIEQREDYCEITAKRLSKFGSLF